MIPDPKATKPVRALRFLEARPLVAVGLVSYSLFLWHWAVINWLKSESLTVGGWGGLVLNLSLVALVSGALSALTYRFVERPALRLKSSRRRSPDAATAAVTTAATQTVAPP
jgi:peptidoglycan/LPS O-acetylase OafA/YrhL